jgi:hypothetical protein
MSTCNQHTKRTDEVSYFEAKLLSKQCQYKTDVNNYITKLKYGVFCCDTLDKLKTKRRVLKMLQRYDTRDIPTNTTTYNIFSYTLIKQLLNSL